MIWPNGYLEPNDYEYSHSLENDGAWPKEQSERWITEEQGKAIKDFVEAGGALYALHNSSHISLSSKDYREVMGGAYITHPALRPFKVSVVNKEHPITRDVQDFIVNDEQHFVTYDKDPNYILLQSENIDGLTGSATTAKIWALRRSRAGHTISARAAWLSRQSAIRFTLCGNPNISSYRRTQ